jgi:hypothetical protein
MFRMTATLVARTLMRPWRIDWSADRGVDFSLTPPTGPVTTLSATRDNRVPIEPACFIDEDRTASPAAVGAVVERTSGDTPGTPGLRAWWSLANKPSRT